MPDGILPPSRWGRDVEKFDLKRLRYFIAVADAGGFSRAAERLNLGQPHLSRQIMSLEKSLGYRLFVRRARHVELTDAGQTLRHEVEQVVLKLDNLPERMSKAASGASGSLCIGYTCSGSFHPLMADSIQTMIREAPQFSLRFCMDDRAHLIEAIVDRRVNAAFMRPPAISPPEVQIDILATEPMLVALHKDHALAGKPHVALGDLADQPFVMCERGRWPETYDLVLAACQSAGFSPRVVLHALHPGAALLLAATGAAITVVPAELRGIHCGSLNFLPIDPGGLSTAIALSTRTDEHIVGVKLLRQHALAAAAARSCPVQI